MSPLELIAAGLGIINIVLVARRTVLNYPFGIAQVVLYGFVFADAHLYSAALLQVFFLGSQLYGWWYWARSHTGLAPVPVRRLGSRGRWQALATGLAGTLVLGWVMSRYTDASAPWWDATTAAWSMVAQILLDRRQVESWPIWVMVDALSIGLYASHGLGLTALLYGAFLVIAVWGWWQWRHAAREVI